MKKAVKDAKEDLESMQLKMESQFAKARANLAKFELKAKKYAAKNPRKAAAIAVGAGAAIGAALSTLWNKAKK